MTQKILGYTRHPASAVWPDLAGEEYVALRDSIDERGLDHPILVLRPSAAQSHAVIDGWQRLRACHELGRAMNPGDIRVADVMADAEIAATIIGLHQGRRHLSKTALARLVIETKLACGMAFASDEGGQSGPPSITRAGVAEEAQVSERTARRAIRDAKADRGLVDPPAPERDPFAPDPEAPPAPAKNVSRETSAAEPAERPDVGPQGSAQPPCPPAPPETAQGAEGGPAAATAPSDAKIIEALEKSLADERDRAEEQEERIAMILEAVEGGEAKKLVRQVNNQLKLINTLKARVQGLQSDLTAERRTVRALRRKLAAVEKALEKEKAKHAK